MKKVSFSKKSLVICLTILLIISISFTVKPKENPNFFEKAVNTVFLPIQNIVKWPYEKIKGSINFFVDMKTYANENEKLKLENAELREKVRQLEIYGIENKELRELLNLSKKYETSNAIVAKTIATDGMWFEVITVNKGKNDGVKENMTVLTPYGLVGKVTKVYDFSAQVTTILDASNVVSSRIAKTNEYVIAKGDMNIVKDGLLKLDYVTSDVPLIEGDVIETSGIGGIYPEGIYIGTIKTVEQDESILKTYALITPGVNFSTIDEVLIIENLEAN